jgi:hypothetical protein
LCQSYRCLANVPTESPDYGGRMSKYGLSPNGWSIVGTICIWGILSLLEFLLWSKKPSQPEIAFFAVLLVFLWIKGRLDRVDDRLKEIESRFEELEDEVEARTAGQRW